MIPGRALLAVLVFAWVPASAAQDCLDCHREQAEEFSRTVMARAAANPVFQAEWAAGGKDPACLGCHAPSGGQGLGCVDCHGTGEHPYAPVAVPQVCARCHDAPGEATVRTFRASLAARAGKTCLDCHLAEGKGHHAFRGASDAGFLSGAARVRLMMRGDTLLTIVDHRAGHGFPGGTTGRAVWLVVRGVDRQGLAVWEETKRFGWLTDGHSWQDHTLGPDRNGMLEVQSPQRDGAVAVDARLLYSRQVRNQPGGEELSRATMILH